MHILDILTVCLKKKLFIGGVPLICAIAAFIIVSFVPQTFYTEMRLRIDDPISLKMPGLGSGMGVGGEGLSAFFGGGVMRNESEQLFLELLVGRENLVSAIEKFSLDTLYKTKNLEGTIKTFKKDLTTSLRVNNVIICGFKARDREMAAAIVNHLVDGANQRFINLQKERLAMSVEFLNARQKQLMDSLEINSRELIDFYRENNVIHIENQIELTLLTLARYEEQINANRIGEMISKNAAGMNTPMSQEFAARNRVLQSEFQKIRGSYGDDYKPSKQSVLINTDWGLDKLLFERIANARINAIRDILTALSKELALSESQLSKNIPAVQIIQNTFYPDWKIAPKRANWMIISFTMAFTLTTALVLLSAFVKGELDGASDANRQKVIKLLKAVWK